MKCKYVYFCDADDEESGMLICFCFKNNTTKRNVTWGVMKAYMHSLHKST